MTEILFTAKEWNKQTNKTKQQQQKKKKKKKKQQQKKTTTKKKKKKKKKQQQNNHQSNQSFFCKDPVSSFQVKYLYTMVHSSRRHARCLYSELALLRQRKD